MNESSTYHPPLASFLDYLRKEGFAITTDTYRDVQVVVEQMLPQANLEDMPRLLAPLIATDEEEQRRFFRLYERYFRRKEKQHVSTPISILPPEPDPAKESNQQIQSFLNSNLLRFILLIITAGFSSVLIWGSISLGLDLYRHFFTDQRSAEILENPTQAVLVWVGIVSITLLFISVALYYVRELLGLSNGKKESSDSKPPPYIYLPPLPTPELSLFSTYESARFSDTFRKQEAGTVDTAILDLPLTIDATVQNAGLIKPIFQKYGTRPSYIFLIDETYTRNLATSWYTYLVEVLREENVSVTHFFYEEIPTTIWGEDRQKMTLDSLNLEGRLLILGRSEGMVDHIDGGLFSWAEQMLGDFPEVGFLTPKAADQWGYYELTLAQYGVVAPANLEGLGSIVDVLNGRQDVEWWEWRDRIDIWDAEDPSPVSLQKDLSHEVFLWLCACAIYPQLEWKLVLKIGEALQETFADPSLLLHPQAIGSLMSIRWFQTGKIPDRARAQLIEYLPEKQERAVRALLQEIMDQARDVPPEGSLAAHNLRIFQLVNQLQLAKGKDQKEALQKEIKELQEEFPVQEDAVLKGEVDKAIQNIPTVNWWSVAMDFFRGYLRRFVDNVERSEIPLTGLNISYSNKDLARAAEALYPFFTVDDLKNATEDYIPTYFQDFSPSHYVQLSGAFESHQRENGVSSFLKIFESRQRVRLIRGGKRRYMILGDTGMGKTTFLLNLFLAYSKRKQNKEHALDIKLLPLGYPDVLNQIETISQPERTILLLDGLDEDAQAVQNYPQRIERILDHVQDFPIVILTCRTQFFASAQDELFDLPSKVQRDEEISRMKVYLSPLSGQEIKRYVNKKYSLLEQNKRAKAQKILEKASDPMSRQMILGYVDEMIEEDLDEAKLIRLFHWIIQRWLSRQAARIPQDRQEQFKEGLWEFSIEATLEMYQNQRMFISSQEIEDLAARNQFGLSTHEMRTRSLLNRNNEGTFKFAHQSFFEYFLATAAATNRKIVGKFAPKEFPLARTFYQEMIDEEIQATFAQRESNKVQSPSLQGNIILSQSPKLNIGRIYSDPRATDNLKRVLLEAAENAAEFNEGEILSLHLWWALLQLKEGVAYKTLARLVDNIDGFTDNVERILRAAHENTEKTNREISQVLNTNYQRLTSQILTESTPVKAMVGGIWLENIDLASSILGTEHLLLSILKRIEFEDSTLKVILEGRKIDYDAIKRILDRSGSSSVSSRLSSDDLAEEIWDIRRVLIERIDHKKLEVVLNRLDAVISTEFRNSQERYSVEELKGRLSSLNQRDYDYQIKANLIIKNTLDIIERLQEYFNEDFPYPRGPLEPYDPIVEQLFQQEGQIQFF
ncbi:MAG: Clp protease N-terminal domain-containing protein, partial [Bacteroidota bacterium]